MAVTVTLTPPADADAVRGAQLFRGTHAHVAISTYCHWPTDGLSCKAGPGNARFLRAALAFLRAQRPPYLAASLLTVRLPGGQDVVRVQFAGPSPLGMLTGGNAGADTSP